MKGWLKVDNSKVLGFDNENGIKGNWDRDLKIEVSDQEIALHHRTLESWKRAFSTLKGQTLIGIFVDDLYEVHFGPDEIQLNQNGQSLDRIDKITILLPHSLKDVPMWELRRPARYDINS